MTNLTVYLGLVVPPSSAIHMPPEAGKLRRQPVTHSGEACSPLALILLRCAVWLQAGDVSSGSEAKQA